MIWLKSLVELILHHRPFQSTTCASECCHTIRHNLLQEGRRVNICLQNLNSEPQKRCRRERWRGRRENMCECLCKRDWQRKREKRWLLLPRQPSRSPLLFNPFSSALSFHLLSFIIAAISHLLMSYHSICPCPYLRSPSLFLSPQYKILICELFSLNFILIIHPLVGTPVILSEHVCFVNSESLCAREQ